MADVDGEGGSLDSEEEVEQFDDVVSEDGEDGEGEVDEDDGQDGEGDGEGDGDDDEEGDEDEDSSSVDEEDDDDDGSSVEAEEQEDEDDQADDVADNGDADAELFGHALQKDLPAISSRRADSPTDVRKTKFFPRHKYPKSYAIDAISALPHPCATNAIAASLCMTHLVTGSDDGYIRDYDIFAACNGTNFLSAPQRQHCGFVEGVIKAGVLRSWWHSSNPIPDDVFGDPVRHPVQSLLMHSDALWGLAGLRNGDINLYSVRHNPGKIIHTLSDHTKEIADMAMSPDEKSFISAGWDGNVLIWDLNTGEVSRRFPSQGSQLSAVALRPLYRPSVTPLVSFGRFLAPYSAVPIGEADEVQPNHRKSESMKSEDRNTGFEQQNNSSRSSFAEPMEKVASPSADAADTKSDGSYDPLFDDDSESDLPGSLIVPRDVNASLAFPGTASAAKAFAESADKSVGGQGLLVQSAPPKGPVPFTRSTPLFDQSLSDKFSSDVILTASINGQVLLWDRRAPAPEEGVGKLEMAEKCPPWCVSACWAADGSQIYAGRRNGTIDIWDVRQLGVRGGRIPRLLKTLRNPVSSGEVFCVAALPDAKHLVCASNDNIRLWNVSEPDDTRSRAAQFKIITGHHGGQVSQILIDPSARFMISASGNRGWFGESTRTVLIHEIKDIL